MRAHRVVAAAAVAFSAALALAGCVQQSPGAAGGDADASGDGSGTSLTVFLSTDTNIQTLWEDSLIPAFVEENPDYSVDVQLDLHGEHDSQTIAKLTSATQQGEDPGYDLVDGGFVTQVAEAGLLTEVSAEDIAGLETVGENILEAGGPGSIPYRASSVLLAYNTDEVSEPPQTLDELLQWIRDNPGRFTYNTPDSGGSGQSFVATVLDHYVPDDVSEQMVTGYHEDLESHWDEGFDVLRDLNPYIYQEGVYPNGNAQELELLASGQIWMGTVWSDQFITGQEHGQIPENIDYTQISDPSFTGGASYLGIPATSPDQEGALVLANWLLSPEAQAIIADSVSGYPVIELDQLPEDVQSMFADANVDDLRLPYFSQMNEDLNRLWAERVPQ
ncbi:MAG TPA: extracellular solute-binding protein [Ruania sp.]|nr:extracellular solute-binding protein [Ruania sp.]